MREPQPIPYAGRCLVKLNKVQTSLALPDGVSTMRLPKGAVLAVGDPLPDDPPMPRVGDVIYYEMENCRHILLDPSDQHGDAWILVKPKHIIATEGPDEDVALR